jgi:hypothetical protein
MLLLFAVCAQIVITSNIDTQLAYVPEALISFVLKVRGWLLGGLSLLGCGWLAGHVGGDVGGWSGGWVCGCFGTWLAGWLAGWLVVWVYICVWLGWCLVGG